MKFQLTLLRSPIRTLSTAKTALMSPWIELGAAAMIIGSSEWTFSNAVFILLSSEASDVDAEGTNCVLGLSVDDTPLARPQKLATAAPADWAAPAPDAVAPATASATTSAAPDDSRALRPA